MILNTGVLAVAVRGRLNVTAITDEDDVAVPALVLAEYLTGVELPTMQPCLPMPVGPGGRVVRTI
ncbi:MAG: hypothetical protein ACRDS1_07685 [Pseudonocardiaceae bacterium]